jgi:ABC-type multidrug transport system ATPase subunit
MTDSAPTGSGYVNLDSVTKFYGSFQALDKVSFDIRKGDIFGYIGPNGAGKTTTIKILVGLLKKFDGSVRYDGQSVKDSWLAISKRVGYLPQATGFQEWRTVNHALTTFGRLSGMSEPALGSRIDYVLKMIGISDIKDKKIIQLSGGTTQKVGMAQAILHEPEILILDEPMAGLDPKSRYEFKEIFKDLSRSGTTIFFSSHILSDVQDLANRIGILNGGRITHLGTAADLEERMKLPKEIDVVLSKDSGKWRNKLSANGVREIVETEPNHLVVRLAKGADVDVVVDELIRMLLSADCKIRKVSPVAPTLEELYIRYLGGADEQ